MANFSDHEAYLEFCYREASNAKYKLGNKIRAVIASIARYKKTDRPWKLEGLEEKKTLYLLQLSIVNCTLTLIKSIKKSRNRGRVYTPDMDMVKKSIQLLGIYIDKYEQNEKKQSVHEISEGGDSN